MKAPRKPVVVDETKGYQPRRIDNGYQPGVSEPGAGHQPAGTGSRPPLPTTGSGVKPPPKKD